MGYLDNLEKEYDDPISCFSIMAKEMTKGAKENICPLILGILE
ncbi:MAG TPA: hypothetical protein VFD57_07885 [Clostridia bacterium]|nr:hypothetical protein [Clostridia bacterium]